MCTPSCSAPVFADLLPNDDGWKSTFVDLEYRVGLVQEATQGRSGGYGAAPGEFIGEEGWSWRDAEMPRAEVAFREAVD